MEVFLECCMTLFFSAAMLLLIVRLAKGEEKNMMFARVFSLASNVGFWIGIVRIAVLNRSGFLMFFYITGAMLSYTAMVFAMPHKKSRLPDSGINKKETLYTGRMEQRCSVRRYAGLFLFQTKVHKILYAFQKLPDQLFCRRVLVLPRVDDKTDFTFGGLLDERNPTDGTAL